MTEDTGRLLAAAAGGDQASWDVLVERHNGLLWSIARSHRLGAADAGDVVQTTWLRLVENLHRIVDPERLGGWLATTARRECLRVLRTSARERPAPTDTTMTEIPDQAEPLDAALLIEERDAALWRALETLSDRCRELLRVLMATPAPAYADVAIALEIPIGSIGPTRQRCLQTLRRVAFGDSALNGATTGEWT